MAKTLRDYFLRGGVEGVVFEDSNKTANRNKFDVPIRYSGKYSILRFIEKNNIDYMEVVDAMGEGLQGTLDIHSHLKDSQSQEPPERKTIRDKLGELLMQRVIEEDYSPFR